MELRAMTTLVVLQVLMGVAFGALAAQTTVALGAYLIAPTAFAAFSTVLGSTAPWFDVFTAYDQLASDRPFAHLGQTTTAVALWVALPCALGLLRSLRREVK
jgi:hypothetical protein